MGGAGLSVGWQQLLLQHLDKKTSPSEDRLPCPFQEHPLIGRAGVQGVQILRSDQHLHIPRTLKAMVRSPLTLLPTASY